MAITRLRQTGAEEGTTAVFDDSVSFFVQTSGQKTGSRAFYLDTLTRVTYARWNIPSTYQIRTGLFYKLGGSGIIFIFGSLDIVMTGSDLIIRYGGTEKDRAYGYNLGSYQHIGIDIKLNGTNGWFYLYSDGNLIASFDGNTGSSPQTQVNYGKTAAANYGTTPDLDDIYLDDTTGEVSPTAPPILRFYPLTLDGNGNYAQWDGSDGNSTDNYQLVDEIGPSDADYVETNIADEYDSYTMTGVTLEVGQTISAVTSVVRASKAGSTEQIALGTRLTSTDSIGSDQTPGTSFGYLSERQTAKPGGGSWGESDVNGAELVIKSRGSY